MGYLSSFLVIKLDTILYNTLFYIALLEFRRFLSAVVGFKVTGDKALCRSSPPLRRRGVKPLNAVFTSASSRFLF